MTWARERSSIFWDSKRLCLLISSSAYYFPCYTCQRNAHGRGQPHPGRFILTCTWPGDKEIMKLTYFDKDNVSRTLRFYNIFIDNPKKLQTIGPLFCSDYLEKPCWPIDLYKYITRDVNEGVEQQDLYVSKSVVSSWNALRPDQNDYLKSQKEWCHEMQKAGQSTNGYLKWYREDKIPAWKNDEFTIRHIKKMYCLMPCSIASQFVANFRSTENNRYRSELDSNATMLFRILIVCRLPSFLFVQWLYPSSQSIKSWCMIVRW